MTEPKVVLSMLVPGAGLLTPEFCEKNPKESYNENKMIVKTIKKKGKIEKEKKKSITFKTRKNRTVTHNIKICKEAYEYMIGTAPSTTTIKGWKSLSINNKLKAHFDLIAADFNAISYSYEILND